MSSAKSYRHQVTGVLVEADFNPGSGWEAVDVELEDVLGTTEEQPEASSSGPAKATPARKSSAKASKA